MAAENLLQRLDGVRETAPGQWLARCPAHADKRASLSIKDADDGRTLIHCFAGCGAADVVAAVGLSLSDLFDKPLYHHIGRRPRDRKRYGQAMAALQALDFEAALVETVAEMLKEQSGLTPQDRQRLQLAVHRIQTARELAA